MKTSLKDFKKINNKGNIGDLFFVISILLIFGTIIIVGSFFLHTLNDEVYTPNGINDSNSMYFISQSAKNYDSGFDNGFIFVFIILSVGVVLSAFLIQNSPIFTILFILSLILIVFFAIVASQIYNMMVGIEGLDSVSLHYPKMSFVMEHFAVFMVVLSILTFIALVSNSGGDI